MVAKNNFHTSVWSHDQRVLWRFLYSKVAVGSGLYLDGCALFIMALGRTLVVALPRWATPAGNKRYGVRLSDNLLTLHYGRHTMDSDTDQSWRAFLPWNEKRFVAHIYYNEQGNPVRNFNAGVPFFTRYEWEQSDKLPRVKFNLLDFDGTPIVATTHLESRRWKHGTKCFKWLSWFVPVKVSRSLSINFSAEVGPEKGSYKGGIVGHAIDAPDGELHESAMRRYCAEHDMAFVGRVP